MTSHLSRLIVPWMKLKWIQREHLVPVEPVMINITLHCPFCKKYVNCPETSWYTEYQRDSKQLHREYTCSECHTVLASGESPSK